MLMGGRDCCIFRTMAIRRDSKNLREVKDTAKSVAYPQPSYPCQFAEVVGCTMHLIASFMAPRRTRPSHSDPQYDGKESPEIPDERGRPRAVMIKVLHDA